jgi:putative transposase
VRQIARAMEVARSNLTERISPVEKPRPKRYSKSDDVWLLEMIRNIAAVRPTYGYRRVTVLLNLELKSAEKPTVNHKRIYRIMKTAGLLLQRHTGKPNRTHDGKVITLHSDTRWCSDAFTIQCWNAERVHVAFSLDTCDREAIRYIASTIGVDGSKIESRALYDAILQPGIKRHGRGLRKNLQARLCLVRRSVERNGGNGATGEVVRRLQ